MAVPIMPVASLNHRPWMSGCPSGVCEGHASALGFGLWALDARLWAFVGLCASGFGLCAMSVAGTASANVNTANLSTFIDVLPLLLQPNGRRDRDVAFDAGVFQKLRTRFGTLVRKR